MKTWNLGNTTVRNPERIRDALKVFRDEYSGRTFDVATQNEFFISLIKADVIKGDPDQPGSRDWSARKWASAFNKLGLALPRGTKNNPVVTITAAGEALLNEDGLESDVFLRQMLKIQLPSPTEDNLDGASIHPFFLVLSVAVELIKRDMEPLGKEEIALFLQSATNDNQTVEIVDSISQYRAEKDEISGKIGKRKFFLDNLLNKATQLYGDQVNKQKMSTLQDYSDTTVRYSAITGIFTIGRQALLIKEDQMNLAFEIVNSGIPKLYNEAEFWGYFHNPALPALPTDNVSFLEADIQALTLRLGELSDTTGAVITDRGQIERGNINKLKKRREDLETELTSLKEIQFYRSQNNDDQVLDIIGLFESIKNRETIGGSDYLPAWAEWNVWRVFLSINTIANPIHETRGFKINSELFPVHHAKGGQADLCFEYDDGTIIPAEITLSSRERQFTMEGEPVRFHVKTIVERNQTNEVIGLFTAPDVHVATAHEFFKADYYSEKLGKVVEMNIVPLTFDQLQSLLPGQRNACNSGTELLGKLRDLVSLKENSSDGSVWLNQISMALA